MKQKVVVEIRGGVLVGLYASDPDTEYCLVDWDEIKEVHLIAGTWCGADHLETMPADTGKMVAGAQRSDSRHQE